jgi:hypothetical protein
VRDVAVSHVYRGRFRDLHRLKWSCFSLSLGEPGTGSADERSRVTETTPEAPFELFQDWQRTQTQSSVTEPYMEVGYPEGGTNPGFSLD